MIKKEPENVLAPTIHPIQRILASRQPGMVLLKYALVLVAAVIGLISLQLIFRSLLRPYVYQKDFIQEYLLSRAVLDGVDPYLSLPELALRFLGPLPNSVLQHPTPHPPPVAILSLLLGLISYEQAAVVWVLFEMICVVAAVYVLLRWLDKRPGPVFTLFITLLVLAWSPFWEEIVIGQLMTLLFILLIAAWLALRAGNDTKGGFLLGCLIALKLMAWPVAVFLAIRRKWRALIAAGVTVAVANLVAAVLMGFDRVVYYYVEVSAIVSPLYRAHEANFSMWTIGWRLFDGTGSPALLGLEAPPLVVAPALARYVSLAVPLALLAIGLWLALHARRFDTLFGILVCVSLLVNPVAWSHYLILAVIPLVIAGRRLFALNLPNRETWAFLALSLLLFIPRLRLRRFILQITGNELGAKSAQVPFSATLLTLVPAVAILGLLWLVWHTERAYPEEAVCKGCDQRDSARGYDASPF